MKPDDINEAALRRRRGEKWNHYAPEVLPAWVADMDFVVAEPIREALKGRVDDADLGYPVPNRETGLTQMFAERVHDRFDWAIESADVQIINDVVQGLYLGLLTYSKPGDGVVIQTPIYPPFLHAAEQTGRLARTSDLVAGDGRYEIDFDHLVTQLDERTRVFMLCNPHNPCGRAFTRGELEQLAAICCERDLVILSDEIHAELVLDDHQHIPVASLAPEVAARTVTLMSASKAFNIAGLCMAFAHFGSPDLKRTFNSVPSRVRGGTNALAVAAVRAAWSEGDQWQREILGILRRNRDRVAEFVGERWPRVRHLPPQATYLAWLDMRDYELRPSPYDYLLAQSQVALGDGRAFGAAGEGFVRLNFATSEALLEEILARLDTAISIL